MTQTPHFPFAENTSHTKSDLQNEITINRDRLVKFLGGDKPNAPGMYFREVDPLDPGYVKATKWDGKVWLSLDGDDTENTIQDLPWYALKANPTIRQFAEQYGRVLK
jgi:hypothetical protein